MVSEKLHYFNQEGNNITKGSYCPLFPSLLSLQMKSQWKGLSLTESCVFILTSFSSAPEHNRDSPDSATVSFFFLSTFPNLQLSQILYMGGTIIPGIAALWEKRGRKKEWMGDWGVKKERERSVMWLLGFICHHNSHITAMCSSIWRTKTTLPHYLFIPRPPESKHFPPPLPLTWPRIDNIVQLLTDLLNSFMQELPLLIVNSYMVQAYYLHYGEWLKREGWGENELMRNDRGDEN